MLNIVVIGYVWPEPNSSAAGQNMLSLIRQHCDAGNNVTFLTAAADSIHKADLAKFDVTSEAIALNCSSFDERIREISPDVVIFDRYMTEEQFSWRVKDACPHALRVLNTEDLHSLRQARHDAVKSSGDASNAQLNTELAQREIASILRSDLTLVISQYEKQLLEHHYNVPRAQLRLHPLFVEDAPISTPDYSQRQHFVHIGNFRHAPNWDAVLQLKQHIWPAIRKKIPDAQLHIYGAYLPKKASQLHNVAQGFIVKGWAENAEKVISSARVLIAPIRFGAGIKGKLLDAMRTHTPSVTTWLGSEGISSEGISSEDKSSKGDLLDTHTNNEKEAKPIATQWPGAICSPIMDKTAVDNFVEHAVSLYQNEVKWQKASQQCEEVLKAYRAQADDLTLPEQLQLLFNGLKTHRESLFLQSLLWHQSLNATKYMSQWIEEKNN
ncbi:MAG: glycosyltransferase [Alteromonadaceae bacterium TMED7]|nr:glycosyl transferase [Alteromonadaceae bacterium]RPH17397.1 MAG: glycosyltransferase [Alteromonadaceae bacterium TMED7]|tara:strand:- start:24643 stop:25959 length:1317 start_codon:yes stop_codon:yes gene_type:complete